MNSYKYFGAIVCSIITISITSCEKSDRIERFPEGTSTLKMMNEDNGCTALGNSDVYITSTGNFKSGTFPILDCGNKNGIGDIGIPNFTNMAPEVAVTPGHGYVICSSNSVMDFPSGEKAIREDALMYRVYVDSWIQQNGKDVGANVYFLLSTPFEHGQIPEMESNIGTLSWNSQNNKSDAINIKLPSEDIEAVCSDDILTFSTKGSTLTLTLSEYPMSYDICDRTFFIRSGRVYTEVAVSVEQSY